MEAIKDNKGLVAVAILLALLIGVSAYNSSNNSDSESAQAETSETQQAEDNKSAETSESEETTETAQETDGDSAEEATTTETESDEADTDGAASYTYTAQPGDSYSVLARKAVQTYGIVNDVKLSLAQILAAEAKITTEASAEHLNEGQSVSISQANVKSAIDYAQGLSDDEEAAWATYVPYVEFDTRSNGE